MQVGEIGARELRRRAVVLGTRKRPRIGALATRRSARCTGACLALALVVGGLCLGVLDVGDVVVKGDLLN